MGARVNAHFQTAILALPTTPLIALRASTLKPSLAGGVVKLLTTEGWMATSQYTCG